MRNETIDGLILPKMYLREFLETFSSRDIKIFSLEDNDKDYYIEFMGTVEAETMEEFIDDYPLFYQRKTAQAENVMNKYGVENIKLYIYYVERGMNKLMRQRIQSKTDFLSYDEYEFNPFNEVKFAGFDIDSVDRFKFDAFIEDLDTGELQSINPSLFSEYLMYVLIRKA